MPAPVPEVTTIAQLLALPDDGLRHELLEGAHVVSPAPSLLHQRALRLLSEHLHGVLAQRNDLEVFASPADVALGPRTLVQPDLFVVRRSPGAPLIHWSDVGVPVLAIEVLSPATAPRDRGLKRRVYQGAGVSEYWIVDLDARLIERWQSDDARPEIADDLLDWTMPGGAAGRLEVPSFFHAVFEDRA